MSPADPTTTDPSRSDPAVDLPLVALNDTTLRDGEQAPGVAFRPDEKVSLALALDGCGVAEIEAGTPAMGGDEVAAIRAITGLGLKARVIAWCRMTEADLRTAAAAGVTAVNLSIPMSELQLSAKLGIGRDEALARIRRLVPMARDMGLEVAVGGEDASRADPDHLVRVAETAQASGAFRLRIADTVGILDPVSTAALVGRITAATDLAIEFHGHDDLGLATANSLAAVRAGARHLSVTVGGLGERAGNAALEEIVVALPRLGLGRTAVDPKTLMGLAHAVAHAAGRVVPPGKAIVGRDVFTHESGIHVAALLDRPETYQGLDPETLGRKHRIVVGKHSGTKAIAHMLDSLGYQAEPDIIPVLVGLVRHRAVADKAPIASEEFERLIGEALDFLDPDRTHAHVH